LEGRKGDNNKKVGVVKAGGKTAGKGGPGRWAAPKSVGVQYKILDNKPTATLKVWGYD